MEDLYMNQSTVRPEQMTDHEIKILQDVIFKQHFKIHPIPVLEYLYKLNCIDVTFYYDFVQKTFSQKFQVLELFECLIQKIRTACSLRTLINVFGELGYHDISKMLLERLLLPGSSVIRIQRYDTSNRKQVQQFFKMLKRKVWNAEYENPLGALRYLAEQLQQSMLSETNVQKRQVLADKVVAVLGAEIDAHAITFDTELSEHNLFKELRKIVPQTTNTMITDVILYGRRANACAIGKHFFSSEKFLQKAKSSSAFLAPCLEIANMIYCEVYVKLWQFEETPTSEIRESLVQMAEVGIECLRDEEEEIRILWTRMFLLRMIFCLLGIGNRANIIPDLIIPIYCTDRARNLLAVLDKTLKDMDTRRKMFYHVAQARLFELEGNIATALRHIQMAFCLSMVGRFKEKSFICQYIKRIESLSNMSLDEISTTELNAEKLSLTDSTENLNSFSTDRTGNSNSYSTEGVIVFNRCTCISPSLTPATSNTPELLLSTAPSLDITSLNNSSFELITHQDKHQQVSMMTNETSNSPMSNERGTKNGDKNECSMFSLLDPAPKLYTESFTMITQDISNDKTTSASAPNEQVNKTNTEYELSF